MLVQVTFPLAAANFMNQAARTVMAIVGPVLAVELGLSAIELGVLAACLFAAYAAAQLPLGVALDAFGARRVQAVLMLLAAIGFAIFALSPGFAGLAAARIVLGIGISAGLMAVIKAHADWFERSRVAHVTGIATAIGALGSALTTSPVQAMLPALGWRGVFWVLCLLALARGDLDLPVGARQAARPGPGANPAGRHCVERSHSRLADLLAVRSGGCDAFDVQLCLPGPLGRPLAARRGRHGRTGPSRRAVPLHLRDGRGQRARPAAPPAGRTRPACRLFSFRSCALVGMVLLQAGLMLQPSQPSVVLVLWLAIAVFGAAGPVGYVVMCQMFPPEQTGRVSTAVNTLTLGVAFLVQAAIGWILDLWPRTASDGWDPDGYSWALALTAALQALAALVMATAQRRGHAISM